jgi:hypothetical protein
VCIFNKKGLRIVGIGALSIVALEPLTHLLQMGLAPTISKLICASKSVVKYVRLNQITQSYIRFPF